MFSIFGLIGSIVIVAIAGTLATVLTGNDSSNMVKNIVIGLIGGILGSILGSLIGIGSKNIIGSIIIATLGSILVLWIYNKYIKK